MSQLTEQDFFIHKESGAPRDNCIYAMDEYDVPDFLLEDGGVQINDDGSITLYAIECPATRDFPVYICWEEVSSANAGNIPGICNCWSKDNGDETLEIRDGVCYNLPSMVHAALITEEIPDWVLDSGFPVFVDEYNGTVTLQRTDWGESRVGRIGDALWLEYAPGDINILDLAEESATEYIVCDENGYDIGWLTEVI